MLLIQDTSADYSDNNVGRVTLLTSNRTSLVGEFMLGRNLLTSQINSAYSGAPPATQVGSPTYDVHKITGMTWNEYLDTQIPDALNITYGIVVAPSAGLTGDCYVGTGPSSTTGQNAMFFNSPNLQLQCENNAASPTGLVVTTGAPTSPLTDFRMLAGRISGLVNPILKVDEFKGGVRTQGGSTTGTATRVVDPRTLAMCSFKSNSLTGLVDCAAMVIWYKLLSDADLLSAYLEVQTALAAVGIAC